jgi:tetratricopeptide (TPR) repeat protein
LVSDGLTVRRRVPELKVWLAVSDLKERYIQITDEEREKARRFFDQAIKVAGAGQYEYAIDMFLSGLALDPEAVEFHQKLRDTGLRRRASGGKKMGMFEKMKFTGRSKDEKQNMLNGERLLALDDTGSLDYMDQIMQASFKAGCFDTTLWILPIYYRAMADSGKMDYARLQRMRDHYANLEKWKEAVELTAQLLKLRPDDMDLKNDLKNLSARQTMHEGKYEKGGSFREMVRDVDTQQRLMEEAKDAQSDDYLMRAIRDAEEQLAKDPNEPGKMMRLVDALAKMGKPEFDEQAMARLDDFYQRTGQFRFRQRMIEMVFKKLDTEGKAHLAALKASPGDVEKQQAYREFVKSRAEMELGMLQEISEQYPTETRWRYEIAERHMKLDAFTEAIPLYQQSVNDPKFRNQGMLRLGQAFLAAGYVDEAIDTLRALIESYQVRDDFAKEMFYSFARANEAKGDLPAASKAFSTVAQMDFNYRDVQKRIKEIRAKMAGA